MRPEAVAAVIEGMARWANPSSPHAEGRAARAALEDARRRIAQALDWPHHVILTSGASESASLALRGRPGIGVAAVEHDAVLRAADRPVMLDVDAGGIVRTEGRDWTALQSAKDLQFLAAHDIAATVPNDRDARYDRLALARPDQPFNEIGKACRCRHIRGFDPAAI